MSKKKAKTFAEAVAELNKRQREAYDEPGNTVLLAGPGSGKTATLVLKVARLLDEIPAPRGLACLTYGNEAAREFEHRLRDYGIRSGGRLFTGTVHSFCLAHILRPFAYRLGAKHRYLATSEIASDAELKSAREAGLDAGGVNEPESWWRSKIEEYRKLALIEPAFAERMDDRLPNVCRGYQAHLRKLGRLDFDHIILGSLVLVRDHEHVRRALAAKYPWFVVDEYQDLGLALHRIVKILLAAGVKVFAVGDPDQSIHGFAGARPEFLDELAKRSDVRLVRLELNYRCRQRIIDASLHVLQPVDERKFLSAVGDDERGEIVFKGCADGLEQQAAYVVERIKDGMSKGLPPGEIGVFAKNWEHLAPCEKAVANAGIPYRIVRGREYKSTPLTEWVEKMALWCAGGWRSGKPRMREIFSTWRRLTAACRGSTGSNAELADRIMLYKTLSTLREPSLAVADWIKAVDTALALGEIAKAPNAAPLRMRHDIRELAVMLASLSDGTPAKQTLAEFSGVDREKVVLQSLHSSKGLEYTTVFMLALEKGIIPRYKEDHREARRLFYVGMTRARRAVHLLFSGFFHNAKGKQDWGPSPFLGELWKRLNPKGE